MTARTRAQLSTALNNHSGPLSSEIFEDFFDSREFVLTHRCNISTDIDEYIVFPYDGTVKAIYTVINGAITTPDETITFTNGVAGAELGVITIAFTSSAAGDVDSLIPTVNNEFSAGDVLEMEIGGESTNGPQTDIVILYQLS